MSTPRLSARIGLSRSALKALPQGLLPGVTDGQVQAHGGDDEDQPVSQQVDAVVLEELRRDQHQQGAQNRDDGCKFVVQELHTLRSSFLPSRPCGLNRITTMKI